MPLEKREALFACAGWPFGLFVDSTFTRMVIAIAPSLVFEGLRKAWYHRQTVDQKISLCDDALEVYSGELLSDRLRLGDIQAITTERPTREGLARLRIEAGKTIILEGTPPAVSELRESLVASSATIRNQFVAGNMLPDYVRRIMWLCILTSWLLPYANISSGAAFGFGIFFLWFVLPTFAVSFAPSEVEVASDTIHQRWLGFRRAVRFAEVDRMVLWPLKQPDNQIVSVIFYEKKGRRVEVLMRRPQEALITTVRRALERAKETADAPSADAGLPIESSHEVPKASGTVIVEDEQARKARDAG